MHFLGKTLLVFALLHSVVQGQICLLLQVFLDFLFCILIPYNEKDIFFGVSSKRSCRASQMFNVSIFIITGQSIELGYRDIEWFALETNRDHSVIFDIASKYCVSDSFVDNDGYSISSKEFLPTVVDIMVI